MQHLYSLTMLRRLVPVLRSFLSIIFSFRLSSNNDYRYPALFFRYFSNPAHDCLLLWYCEMFAARFLWILSSFLSAGSFFLVTAAAPRIHCIGIDRSRSLLLLLFFCVLQQAAGWRPVIPLQDKPVQPAAVDAETASVAAERWHAAMMTDQLVHCGSWRHFKIK